jgi:predicted alpha/beta superfamily hydrolase
MMHPRAALHAAILFVIASSSAMADAKPSTASARVHVLTPPLLHAALPAPRSLRIYVPSGHADATRRFPVIYMADGQNLFDEATAYAGEWGVDEAMDAFARAGFEAIVVGVDHGGERRMQELAPWRHPDHGEPQGAAFLAYVVETVKPFVDANYPTLPDAPHTAFIGSSMGGLMAHYALHARPDVFGRAGVLSPSLWFSVSAYDYARTRPRPPDARVFVSMGTGEGTDGVARVEALGDLLRSTPNAANVKVRIVDGAEHNEAAWRALFPDVVRFLFELPAER